MNASIWKCINYLQNFWRVKVTLVANDIFLKKYNEDIPSEQFFSLISQSKFKQKTLKVKMVKHIVFN